MNAKKVSGKKLVAVLLALVLVIGGTIGGTLAWLSAQTDAVTNTFTVGDINITLTETTGDSYKIVPGGTDAKDPKITVKAGSEKCYVYALVTNTVKVNGTVVATPDIDNTKWDLVKAEGDMTLYRYKEIVNAATADAECQVFTEVSYDGELITETTIKDLENKTIVIDAYAHQSDNTTQAVADEAAMAHFGFTANP